MTGEILMVTTSNHVWSLYASVAAEAERACAARRSAPAPVHLDVLRPLTAFYRLVLMPSRNILF